MPQVHAHDLGLSSFRALGFWALGSFFLEGGLGGGGGLGAFRRYRIFGFWGFWVLGFGVLGFCGLGLKAV